MAIFAGLGARMKFRVFAAGGTADHVHLLISLPRTISISKAVQLLKSGSSKWIHENFSGSRTFAWQEGHGAFSVGASQRATTVKYILAQIEHHKRISFDDELKKFLSVHGINEDFSRP
jgi:putative transposase